MHERQETDAAAGPSVDALWEFVGRLVPSQRFGTAQTDAAAAEVLAAFDAAGVDVVLLKGPALARMLYTPDEQRDYVDVDLIVAPTNFDAAQRSLAALGYSTADGVAGIDDVGGVVHDQMWVRAAQVDQSMIDLHRWLPGSRASPHVVWEALAAHRSWIEVGGRQAAVLDRPGLAMHLAMHAAQHGPAFTKQLDELALALERWPAGVWDSAAALAHRIEATATFAAGLRLLPQGAAEAVRLGLPPTGALDWTVRHRQSRPRGTFHLQALAEAQGALERLSILRRSLLPRREWIIHQHPWGREGRVRLVAAYGAHLARSPAWAVRAWLFTRRARRAGADRRAR